MLKRCIAFISAIALLINLTGCNTNNKKRYEAEFLSLFDTMTQIVAYADTKEEFTRFSQYFYDELNKYHKLYDIYNTYGDINNIKTINDSAGKEPVKVDKKIIDLLLLAKEMYIKTNGKINVAYGSVLQIWHDYREKGTDDPESAEVPPLIMLQEAAQFTDINKVIIDTEASTVFLEDAKMSLDVGSVGKGYATEQVCKMAEAEGYTDFLASVGGNIRAVGTKDENGTLWNVGVRDPDNEDDVLCNAHLSDASLVTSGNYERYYSVEGKNYHHIIDPNTLMPSEYFTAVTIICPDSGIADCLSTAIFNMPFDEGKAFIESTPNTEALWVFLDKQIVYSSGFINFLQPSI
ncbi:MAG: FAD:protein FMN transferase [Oscillospiraceae bacterium]|nr:FAD:protein FMN transferase [Oscillospiraceae bacterium]